MKLSTSKEEDYPPLLSVLSQLIRISYHDISLNSMSPLLLDEYLADYPYHGKHYKARFFIPNSRLMFTEKLAHELKLFNYPNPTLILFIQSKLVN